MNLLERSRKFFVGFALVLIAVVSVMGFSPQSSQANALQLLSTDHALVASTGVERRVDATAKDLEGRLQEGVGKVTDSSGDRVEGRLKRAEGQTRLTAEDVKDDSEGFFNDLQRKAENLVDDAKDLFD